MEPRIIKTEADYEAALAHVAGLMNAVPGSPDERELELFSLLIEQYEKEHFPIPLPDPIDALVFRMEQQGLTRQDLIRYIGSASKISEVLNRKRPLSLAMIRALHIGLGIPAEVLLQQPGQTTLPPVQYHPRDYPFGEMVKRGYFGDLGNTVRSESEDAEALLAGLFVPLKGCTSQSVYCRSAKRRIDANALLAWQARALSLIQSESLPIYDAPALDDAFLARIVHASYYVEGPRLVPELLHKRGIHFVLLPHLPKTYLDGACFLSPAGRPVVGMTLRFDRLDNFWFTLAHELAHLRLHVHEIGVAFFDETERHVCENDDPREAEANALAQDMLIPRADWQRTGPGLLTALDDTTIQSFAEQLGVASAVIAGRIRWERQDFSLLTSLVGNRQVRSCFEDFQPAQ